MYLAQNLKYLREQKGMNQNEMANVLGISQSAVGHWETGRREPELSMLVRIAEYFGVTLDGWVLRNLRPPITRYTVNLRFLRKKYNMVQADIGKLLNLTPKCVSKYERGESSLEVEKLIKLADFFGVTLDQMVKQDLSKGSERTEVD